MAGAECRLQNVAAASLAVIGANVALKIGRPNEAAPKPSNLFSKTKNQRV